MLVTVLQDDNVVGWSVELAEDITHAVKSEVRKSQISTERRPAKLTQRRGIAGGLKSNVRLKHQKSLSED